MKKPLPLLFSFLILAAPLLRADDAKPATPAATPVPMVTGPSVNQTGDPMPDKDKGAAAAKKAKKKAKKKKDAAPATDSATPAPTAIPGK